jgi:hypothetical protein
VTIQWRHFFVKSSLFSQLLFLYSVHGQWVTQKKHPFKTWARGIAALFTLTYDSSQAVMVAWRLFREAIAHRRYTLSFYIGMSLTRRCPVNRQSVT